MMAYGSVLCAAVRLVIQGCLEYIDNKLWDTVISEGIPALKFYGNGEIS